MLLFLFWNRINTSNYLTIDSIYKYYLKSPLTQTDLKGFSTPGNQIKVPLEDGKTESFGIKSILEIHLDSFDSGITTLPDYFLANLTNCMIFDITIFEHIETIGSNFLNGCWNFNHPLNLNSVKIIDMDF